ncbi:uncharacterized protein [Ptychodera flava]|uniref:uncharacterized protein isoform X4 n=1 Tax=Ptychodera flava TaxID=63121 RepID=UPI003969E080
MMRLDVTLGEFLTVMTVLVCVPVYGEEWSWSRPCVIERGKCSTQMTDAGMKCNIAESGKGSQCERFEPVRWTEIPDKPTDFKARLDTDTVVTANNVTENHIMANLSWTIDTFGNHPQGFHVLLRGLTNHGEYMYDYFHEEWCFTINMTGFDYKNVYSRYLTFQFDCFRPLAPYCEYQLVVRTLPVTEEVSPDGKTGPTSTQASLRFTTPPCDDDRISRTTQCLLKEKASHWQPTYLIPSSPAYNKIKVKFDLPPQRYGLTSYGISIYRYNRESIGFPCSKFVDDAPEVFQNDTNVQISNISIDGSIVSSLEYTFVRNFPAGNYCMKLHPGPDDRCWSPTGSFCRTSVTGEFEVKDPDPCFSDPCGINHRCLPLNKTHYSCNCTERYYFDDVTCKEDHCYSNPCRHGECIRTDSSYLCNCSSEHTFHGGVCVPQVSVSDPLKIASVTLGSIFAFVLAGLASWCYWRQSATLPILIPDRKTTADKASNDIEGIAHPKVLLLYKRDSEMHIDVIQFLASFLTNQLHCDVIFDNWDVDSLAASLTDWVMDKMEEADKIVTIASKGTQTKSSARAGDETRQGLNPHLHENCLFSVALGVMAKDLASESDRLKRYVNVHFNIPRYSEEKHIPEVSKVIASKSFKLPQELEHLYIHLRHLSPGSIAGHRKVEGFKERLNGSSEGKALLDMIESVKRYEHAADGEPNLYEHLNGNAAVVPQGENRENTVARWLHGGYSELQTQSNEVAEVGTPVRDTDQTDTGYFSHCQPQVTEPFLEYSGQCPVQRDENGLTVLPWTSQTSINSHEYPFYEPQNNDEISMHRKEPDSASNSSSHSSDFALAVNEKTIQQQRLEDTSL